MAVLHSINLAAPSPNPYKDNRSTGIGKHPKAGPVELHDPGARGIPGSTSTSASGVAGDFIGDLKHHGGSDQAVYAVAREDLDYWQERLGRTLDNGAFGENLSTGDLDVNGALIGERWRIGSTVELTVTSPRLPCATFRGWMNEPAWLKTFTAAARPGAYLKVSVPGSVQAADSIEVVHRPKHDISISLVFRALTLEPALLPGLLAAEANLPDDILQEVAEYVGRSA